MAASVATTLAFPSIVSAVNRKPTIRVVGTHVTLQEEIKRQAEKDLGINIEFYPGGSAEVLLKASTNPESFDLYEQWSNSIKVLWRAGAIKPIQVDRIGNWSEINSISKTGRISERAQLGAGDAPNKLLYVQSDGTLSQKPSDSVSFVPYVHNVDSFGYNASFIEPGIPYETESWSWLLDKTNSGKVAIVNAPTIGVFDPALAVKAKGLMTFNDIGNLNRRELDQLFEIIVEYKRRGHFRGTWSSVPNSVYLMQSGQVNIQSMFSPGVASLRGNGIRCLYAAPKEGYRAWQGVMCLSSACEGERLDAVYQYMNWWLSGWPGAFIAKQGYYISNPDRSRPFMSENEWRYWYLGQATETNLKGTDAQVSVLAGETRRGGSYQKRFENIVVWNSVMDQYEYSLLKWKEFLLA
ncbi:hypothetical protein RED65_08909 [Oceanobacter sp. RED65]|uniref:Signal peptide prediction n=2 Tax=Bermanella marisrubri TaxID=207949 RepID=Q1N6U4_9GAMM|nr:hypothetical protein RED65_08909 [Oceanobacter sp. RED65] [Bermanella marisrubri]